MSTKLFESTTILLCVCIYVSGGVGVILIFVLKVNCDAL